jgi:predicted nuclease of predicted toxin-antitoxin system
LRARRPACSTRHPGGRIVVTLATDFADICRYDPTRSPGVIVLRPGDLPIQASLECLTGAIRALAVELTAGTLWIVEPQRLRIRDFSSGD